jgi:hypothetical protein
MIRYRYIARLTTDIMFRKFTIRKRRCKSLTEPGRFPAILNKKWPGLPTSRRCHVILDLLVDRGIPCTLCQEDDRTSVECLQSRGESGSKTRFFLRGDPHELVASGERLGFGPPSGASLGAKFQPSAPGPSQSDVSFVRQGDRPRFHDANHPGRRK